MAENPKTPRPVALFTSQGATILSEGLQIPRTGEKYQLRAREEDIGRENEVPETLNYSVSSGLHCLSCQHSFASREEQIDHYRLDWHRYNLKRRLKGQAAVSQEVFERIAGV